MKRAQNKDRAETEIRLLAAAKEVFSKHGYEGASTRQIAERAGANVALINRYFDGKYGLLLAVIQRDICVKEEEEISSPSLATLKEECVRHATARFDRMMSDLDFVRIVITQFLTDREFTRRFQELALANKGAAFRARVARFFAHHRPLEAERAIGLLVDIVERGVLGAVLFQYIIKGESKALVRRDLCSLVEGYCDSIARSASKSSRRTRRPARVEGRA